MIRVGPGHGDLSEDASLSFEAAMRPGALDPPNQGREDGRIRITAAVTALNRAVADYSAAVARDQDHPQERVRMNVRNALRAFPMLAAILDLS